MGEIREELDRSIYEDEGSVQFYYRVKEGRIVGAPLIRGPRRPVYVYGLRSSANGIYRYVGSTVDWRVRRAVHRWKPSSAGLKAWKEELKAAGETLELDILEESTERDAWAVEMRWMAKLIAEGHPLLNKRQKVCKYWR